MFDYTFARLSFNKVIIGGCLDVYEIGKGNFGVMYWSPSELNESPDVFDKRTQYVFRVKALKNKEVEDVGERSYGPPAY